MNTNCLPARSLAPLPVRLLGYLILGFFILSGVLPAAIRTVTNVNDSGSGSLRQAIADAGNGDTIQFGIGGTINLESGLYIPKSLSITNSNAAGLTIQRNPAAGTPEFRIILISGPVGSIVTVNITGVTLRNGFFKTFPSNQLNGGGAICTSGCNLTVNNCVFADNVSEENGGAIFCRAFTLFEVYTSKLTLNGCTFSGNSCIGPARGSAARGGGAIFNLSESTSATLDVNNCVFTGNSSVGDGGAIYNTGSASSATIGSSTFTGNTAPNGWGGAVGMWTGNVVVGNCTFTENSGRLGGALFGGTYLSHSCFYDNDSQNPGRDVYCLAHDVALVNSTFHSASSIYTERIVSLTSCYLESASAKGESASLSLGNCIINGNLENDGGTITSGNYNLCRGNGGGFLTGSADQINTNPKLDPRGLRNNGGDTLTIALLSDSPALDKGLCYGITQDQRYRTRPVNLASHTKATGGDESDIGPLEIADPIQAGPELVVTTLDDHDDGIAGMADCTLREAIARANERSNSVISFAPGLNGTITLLNSLGPLQPTQSVYIMGPGARTLAISGGDAVRLLDCNGGLAHLFLAGLTLRNGKSVGANAAGAAIYAPLSTNLVIRDCAFTDNQSNGLTGSQPGQFGSSAKGGAIYSTGSLNLVRCSFNGNAARGGSGFGNTGFGRGGDGGSGWGGAVFINSGPFSAENCTFYNNTGQGGNGGNNTNFAGGNGGDGRGAIHNLGSMTLTSCTITGNSSTGGTGGDGTHSGFDGVNGAAGGALTSTGTASVRNTISAANLGGIGTDVSGIFSSGGYNFIGRSNGSSGFTAPTDRAGTSSNPLIALLGSYQDNGGPTNTILPSTGSLALDGGHSFGVAWDQKRTRRAFDIPTMPNAIGSDGTDIGAAESQSTSNAPADILSLERVGSMMIILGRGPSNSIFRFQLQSSNDLVTPFADIGVKQVADPNGFIYFADPNPHPTRDFFRIVRTTVP